ncbi:MAG: hypothetical protein VB031_04190 [Eubacteriaceae bacterium]|nr:hypothetical protein [Eubacteriaceae bacterium]
MGDFLDKAKKLGAMAADKTSDVAEIGKYKAKIASQKAEIKDLEKQIGKRVYDQFKERDEDEPMDENLLDLCQSIDSAYDEITILEDKIENVKNDKD